MLCGQQMQTGAETYPGSSVLWELPPLGSFEDLTQRGERVSQASALAVNVAHSGKMSHGKPLLFPARRQQPCLVLRPIPTGGQGCGWHHEHSQCPR